MIDRPTVLILGAGASIPYGFPSGTDLVDQAVKGLSSENETLFGEIRRLDFHSDDIVDFRERLRLSGAYSIDGFLEGGTGVVVEIGKAVIASLIVRREDDEYLFRTDISGNWYRYLWNHLRAGATKDSIRFSGLSIITFNYDVSFERYFTRAIKNTFDLRPEQARELFHSAVSVVHVHGDTGSAETYGTHAAPLAPGLLRKTMTRIQVIHDVEGSSNEFVDARRLISAADIVCFLGFGYHPTNVQRLKISDGLRGTATLLGTIQGLMGEEVERAKRAVVRHADFRNHDALNFLRDAPVL